MTRNATRPGPVSFSSPAARALFVAAVAAAVTAPSPPGVPQPPATASVLNLTLGSKAGPLLAAVQVAVPWRPMDACFAYDAAQCVTWRYSAALRDPGGPATVGAAATLDLGLLNAALIKAGLATRPPAYMLTAIAQGWAPAAAPTEAYLTDTRQRAGQAERWEVLADPAGPAFRDVLAIADGDLGL